MHKMDFGIWFIEQSTELVHKIEFLSYRPNRTNTLLVALRDTNQGGESKNACLQPKIHAQD